LKHGQGMECYKNGDTYSGKFANGKASGNGEYTWANGSRYFGNFKNGKKDGFGKWRKSSNPNSSQYIGMYFQDKKEGFGIFYWPSGNIYIGLFKNDERDGIGEMRWTDGSVYLGTWEKGIQNGYGKMFFPEGIIKEGLFEQNIYKCSISFDRIPHQFKIKNFNIFMLAPKNIDFTESLSLLEPTNKKLKLSSNKITFDDQRAAFSFSNCDFIANELNNQLINTMDKSCLRKKNIGTNNELNLNSPIIFERDFNYSCNYKRKIKSIPKSRFKRAYFRTGVAQKMNNRSNINY